MLRELLQGLLHPKTAPNPILEPPKPQSDRPRVGQLSEALKRYQENMPMENLDGTYTNQPVNTSIFKQTGRWMAPLKPGLTAPGDNLARFDPLGSKERLPDRFYPILKINPDSVPKPLPFAQYIRENP